MRSWLTVFAPTGYGKTSVLVARVHDERKRALTAAEMGPVDLPPEFLYTTGYELSESTKRRRLGEDEHELVRKAKVRKLLILDELHPLHTPRDVAFVIIDTRLRAELPTVILAGMDRESFGLEYGAHTLRRLLDFRSVDVFPRKVATAGANAPSARANAGRTHSGERI